MYRDIFSLTSSDCVSFVGDKAWLYKCMYSKIRKRVIYLFSPSNVSDKCSTKESTSPTLLGFTIKGLYDTLYDPEPSEPVCSVRELAGDFARILNSFITSISNIPYQRHQFRQLKQEATGTLNQSFTKLHQQGLIN